MSKSKKNVVDPDSIISKYGADTARLFMISDSPPERDLEWSLDGIKATYKYLNKIYNFLISNKFNFTTKLDLDKSKLNNDELLIYDFLNSVITNYTDDIKNYRFNNAVAKIRELSNKLIKQKISKPLFDYCWSTYLRLFSIITPHFSSELAEIGGFKKSFETEELDKNDIYARVSKIQKILGIKGLNCKVLSDRTILIQRKNSD